METDCYKLLFVDRFRPRVKGVELMLLQHILRHTLDCEGLTANARQILFDVNAEFNRIQCRWKIPDPPDCFDIY